MIEIKLRAAEEIQRAHDLLQEIVNGSVPNPFPIDQRLPTLAALSVLCWVLHHHDDEGFGPSLQRVEAWLAEQGYTKFDAGYPGAVNQREARGERGHGPIH